MEMRLEIANASRGHRLSQRTTWGSDARNRLIGTRFSGVAGVCPSIPPQAANSCRAFSLVEVAMALGIFAFAIMGIVGLLPVGLNAFKESKARSVEALIVQQRANRVLQTPFKVLTNAGNTTNTMVTGLVFYSEDGVEITDATTGSIPTTAGGFSGSACFASRVDITPSLTMPGAVSTNVLQAVIHVARLTSGTNFGKFPIAIANLGK